VEAVVNATHDTEDQLIVSASERQAAKVLSKAHKFAETAILAGVPIKITSVSESRLKFGNGAEILSLPQNPETIRGFTGSIFLDEAAHYRNGKAIYEAIFPTITRGGRLRICTTPLSESGLFWDLWTNDSNKFWKYKLDINKAIKDGLQLFDEDGNPAGADFLRANMDEEGFRREYLCEFVDESTSYFPFSLIYDCVGQWRSGAGVRYLGVDVARKHDFTAIYVLEQLGDTFGVKRSEVVKGANFETQKKLVKAIIEAEDIKRGLIDESGLGMQLAEEINKEFPQVRGMYFTNDKKEEMAVDLKRHFENQQIVIPDDRDLVNDIHSVKRHVTGAGNFRFDAERTAKGHADRFWALGMALRAAKRKPVTVKVY